MDNIVWGISPNHTHYAVYGGNRISYYITDLRSSLKSELVPSLDTLCSVLLDICQNKRHNI